MELVDDEDVETMIALYSGNGSDKNSPIHLFAELAGIEQNEDLTAYGEEHATEEPCVVAPISYVDSESTIRGIDIDLNVTPDIDVVGDDGCDNSDHCDEEVDSDSDPDVDDMWEIRKFVGPHTCTSIRMTEDHGKLDSKTICTFIMPMVKDMPTIKV
ncbi:hypothetical protein GOBAR_AA32867 [Gossypium barbadense]|uniref:Transposase MuDR plant domain-containing protein n=1 Tax=Gossypium barbadense TaxID=3634 RepID=A0A2P5W9P1_GOSBA|nr:hypothetical protein GOBAR_AA32867 [Gossypium barbadense]